MGPRGWGSPKGVSTELTHMSSSVGTNALRNLRILATIFLKHAFKFKKVLYVEEELGRK